MSKLKALGSRVVAKPFPAEEKLAGRFSIPKNSQVKPNAGTVVSAGSDIKDGIKEGDIILYEPGYGLTIIDENVEYIVLDNKNIFAYK